MADYTIKSGDTLTKIAQRNNTTVSAIMAANPYITDANKIYAGKTLVLPGAATTAPVTAPVAAAPVAAPVTTPVTAPAVTAPTVPATTVTSPGIVVGPPAQSPTDQQIQSILSGVPVQATNNYGITTTPVSATPPTGATNTYGVTQEATPFSYDPSTDVGYQRYMQEGNASIMQEMANRGVINSTTTTSQLAQLLAQATPQFEQAAYNRWADEQSRALQRANFLSGLDQNAYSQWSDQQGIALNNAGFLAGQDQQAFANQQTQQENAYTLWGQLANLDDDSYAQYKQSIGATQAQRTQNINTVQQYYTTKSDALKKAIASVNSLGYADNEAALVLGVAVGTPLAQTTQAITGKQQELQSLQMQLAFLSSQNAQQTQAENQAMQLRDAYYNPRVLQEIASPTGGGNGGTGQTTVDKNLVAQTWTEIQGGTYGAVPIADLQGIAKYIQTNLNDPNVIRNSVQMAQIAASKSTATPAPPTIKSPVVKPQAKASGFVSNNTKGPLQTTR